MNYLKNNSNKKRLISILKILKEKMIQKFDLIDIFEINALAYYYLIKNKKTSFFL